MAVVGCGYSVPGSGGEIATALRELCRRRHYDLSATDIIAWNCIAELYLAHLVCGVSERTMRVGQYAAREDHRSFPVGCEDYDMLYSLLAGSADAVGVCLHLPDSDGFLHEAWVDRQMVFDMFDFCRDGIG